MHLEAKSFRIFHVKNYEHRFRLLYVIQENLTDIFGTPDGYIIFIFIHQYGRHKTEKNLTKKNLTKKKRIYSIYISSLVFICFIIIIIIIACFCVCLLFVYYLSATIYYGD